MSKTIIITGKARSGKTTKAKELTKGKKTVWIDPGQLSNAFAFDLVKTDTERIVIDGAGLSNKILCIVFCKRIEINKRGSAPFEIDRPELIIVSNEKEWSRIKGENIEHIQS